MKIDGTTNDAPKTAVNNPKIIPTNTCHLIIGYGTRFWRRIYSTHKFARSLHVAKTLAHFISIQEIHGLSKFIELVRLGKDMDKQGWGITTMAVTDIRYYNGVVNPLVLSGVGRACFE